MDRNSLVSKYLAVLSIVIIFALLSQGEPKRPDDIPIGDYSYTIDFLDYQIEKLMKEHDLPSVVVAMIDGNDVIYKKAYGISNIENKTLATLDTVYKMGSITKLFTGIEIMRLYEDGLIDLDVPITEYLHDFSIKSNFPSEPITIRSILSHRSGLPRGGTLLSWYWEAKPEVLKALTNSLSKSYQAYPVGYRYKYSNIGYNVLGRIIEVVRKVELPDKSAVSGWPYYMKDEILIPLNMNDSEFGSEMLLYGKESSSDVAMGYYNDNGKNFPYNQYDIITLASGSLQSTMNDMIKFSQYILNIDTADIINGDTLKSMFVQQNKKPSDQQTNGLAWFTDKELLDELVVFHSGTNQGFISLVMLAPEKDLGFVIFSNSDEFEDVQNILAIDTLELMLETKTGNKIKTKELQDEIKIDRSTLEKYTGKYVLNGEIIEILLKDDRLKALYNGRKIKMVPYTERKFRLSHMLIDVENIELEFFTEEDLMVITHGDHFVCPKYQENKTNQEMWDTLVGNYDIHARIPSIYSDKEILGSMDIYIKDNVLYSTDGKVLKTTENNEIIIVGGIFDGEIMTFDEQTRNITWQHLIFKPAKNTNK